MPNDIPIDEGKIVGFIIFPVIAEQYEMPTASSISYNGNHDITSMILLIDANIPYEN